MCEYNIEVSLCELLHVCISEARMQIRVACEHKVLF